MLTVIQNPLNPSYAGMLKKPDMSLVIGDLSDNEYDIETVDDLSMLFDEDNSHDLILGLFDQKIAVDVFKLFTTNTYLNALEGSRDLVFVGLYELGEQSLIIWTETLAAGQATLRSAYSILDELSFINSFCVNKSILDDETNEFHDDIQDSPELKAALYQVIL
jgi:hypothetical protein